MDALLGCHSESNTVDDLQERQGTRFDDVGADAPAIDDAAIVLGFDVGFALGVLADGHAAHPVIPQLHLNASDLLYGFEHSIDRAVAEACLADDGAVLMPQTHRRGGDGSRASVAGDRL